MVITANGIIIINSNNNNNNNSNNDGKSEKNPEQKKLNAKNQITLTWSISHRTF